MRTHAHAHTIPAAPLPPLRSSGSQLAGKAKVLWQTADEWNQSLANNTGVEFGDSTDLQWIVANAPSAVFPGYLQTMDNYVQVLGPGTLSL